MFGYVTPCKLELKVKDYEKFKSYYCGLCKNIKKYYGNIPRLILNYDMTFLAVLLDSLSISKTSYKKGTCFIHPLKKKVWIDDNPALEYAAFCNLVLVYYKLKDNKEDEKSLIYSMLSDFIGLYMNKNRSDFNYIANEIKKSIEKLNLIEKDKDNLNIDEISHPFSNITGFIFSSYVDFIQISTKERVRETLYTFGYNLGKWIYIIDAYDDLENDLNENKFNPILKTYNLGSNQIKDYKGKCKQNINFLLDSCASSCLINLDKLPITKNEDLLQNIIQLGLVEKMNNVLDGRDKDEQSI